MLSVLSVTLAILCVASVSGIPISSTQLTIGCFLGVIIQIQGFNLQFDKFGILITAW